MEKLISKCSCRALNNYVHKCDWHLSVSYYDFFFTEVTFTSEPWHWCNMHLQNPSVPFPVWQYYIYIGSCAGHNRSSESLRRKFWRGNQLVTASIFLVYVGGPHVTDYNYVGLVRSRTKATEFSLVFRTNSGTELKWPWYQPRGQMFLQYFLYLCVFFWLLSWREVNKKIRMRMGEGVYIHKELVQTKNLHKFSNLTPSTIKVPSTHSPPPPPPVLLAKCSL